MSQEDLHQESRVAYCESEYDEEEDVTPLANIAVKRKSYERRREWPSSDSGYSSKTGTNTSTSSTRRDMAELSVDTSVKERQPQPYAFIQRADTQRRRASGHSREEVEPHAPSPRTYYQHSKGECWVCDRYGEHIPENIWRDREAAAPPAPKISKPTQGQNAQRDEVTAGPARRDSSSRAPRPVSMYAAGFPQFSYQPTQATNVMQYAASPMSPAWSTPLTPIFQYTPNVMTAAYVAGTSYFEQPMLLEHRPQKSSRRLSIYGDAIIRQPKVETKPKEQQRDTSTRDHGSDRSGRSQEYDRSMPPPPRPAEVTLAHRPSIKKSATYNTPVTTKTNRRSQDLESDQTYVNTAQSPYRERRPQVSNPPSSYRGPPDAGSDARPPNRKSASYSTPTHTTKVSSSILPAAQGSLPRRSTTTATPAESRKIAAAEEYQAQRRSLTSDDLTAEALRSLKQRHSSSQSETSSHRSHHTKSSSSAGGKSKRSNSEIKMTINGINVMLPASENISISARKDGDVSISLGGRGDHDRDGSRTSSQKRIERAPSTTSRASRVSSKSIGSKEKERERPNDGEREMGAEEYERQRRRSNTSRSRSRADAVPRIYDRDRDSPNPWKE